MRTLVTGGAGRIGSRVTQLLLARGEGVTNLDLRESPQAGVTNVVGGFDDAAAVARAMEGQMPSCTSAP